MTCVLLLCACGKVKTNNSKTPDIVPESASYYEGHNLVLADEYKNEKEYSHATIRPWLYDDNYIVVAIFADKLSSDSNTLPEQYINLYDYDGNLINQTDLYSLEDIKTVTELCIGKAKDGMNVIIADQKSNCLILYNVGYESMTWQKKFALPLNDFNIGFLPKHLFEVDDGYVIAYDWLDGSNYRSNIAKLDLSGKVIWDTKSSTKNNLYKADIWNDSLLYSDDFNQFYKVDLKTGKDQQIQKNDTLKTYTNNVFILPEGRIIDAFGQEIRQYNLNDHTEIVLADLNYTDCNMSSICRGLVHADDKRIVTRDFFSYGNEAWGRCKLTVLEKADRNPHAGKKVLEIAPVWGINEIIGETQRVFNINNKDYYAYISTRYDSTFFSLPEYQQEGENLADTVNLITDQLTVDIRNGNGPDIIIGLGDSLNWIRRISL